MATNDFLQVGGSATAILTQSQWSALTQRTNGWSAGVLLPEHYNKALRQSGTMSAMIGEFIKTVGVLDALDDGNLASLLANYVASLKTMVAGLQASDPSSFKAVTSAPVTAPPGSPVAGDEVPVADSPTGGFAGQARKLARYNGSGWDFQSVRIGRVIRVTGTDTYYQMTSTGWAAWSLATVVNWGTILGSIAAQTDLQTALNAKVNKSGDTMTGNLGIAKADPRVDLNKADGGQFATLNGLANGSMRWGVHLGDNGAESGANAGSDFVIYSYSDAGAYLSTPFQIKRSSGAIGIDGANYGASGNVLSSQGASAAPAWKSPAQLMPVLRNDFITAAGSASWYPGAGSWAGVPLNTLITSDIAGASVSGGSSTLPAGTYEFEGRLAMAAAPGTFWQLRLRNVSDGTVIAYSPFGFANGYETQSELLVSGSFSAAVAKVFAFEVYASSASTGNWRNGTAASSTAQIASLKFKKVG